MLSSICEPLLSGAIYKKEQTRADYSEAQIAASVCNADRQLIKFPVLSVVGGVEEVNLVDSRGDDVETCPV